MAGDPWGAASGPFPSSGKGGFFQNLLSSQAKALHVTPKTLKNAQPAPPTKAQQAFQDFQNKQGARGSVGHQITHVGSAIFQGVTGTKPSTLGYLAQHPFASVQMKGPYATKNLPHTTINGKSVPLNIGIVPFFGGKAKIVEDALGPALGPKTLKIAPYVSREHETPGSIPDQAAYGQRGYVYHRAHWRSLPSIRRGGLNASSPVGKGGTDIHGVYFSTNPLTASRLAGRSKGAGSIYFRAREENLPGIALHPNKGYGEMISPHSVPPENLEYLGKDGAWHPVKAPPVAALHGPKTLGQTVGEALSPVKGLYRQQKAVEKVEQAQRFQEAGKLMQANPGEKGHQLAKGAMAGAYTKTPYNEFKTFGPGTKELMIQKVQAHEGLNVGEKIATTEAINKVFRGELPAPFERKLIEKSFGIATAKKAVETANHLKRAWAFGKDVLNVQRSFMSSGDASGTLRQALLVAVSHPGIWAKNIPEYIKAIKSEQIYNAGMDLVHNDPFVMQHQEDFNHMNLGITEMSSKAGPTGSRTAVAEEAFPSPLAERIPVAGRIVRMSGRGYTLFLDKVRVDLAKKLYMKALSLEGKVYTRVKYVDGKPSVVREPLDPHDPEFLKGLGEFVNSATGRGNIGRAGGAGDALNLFFFSPRLAKSRLDFLVNPLFYNRLHPLVRHEAYKAMAGLIGMVALADTLANAAGAGVNLDPRSADFAKIKIPGGTRIDLAGGFQQYIRTLSEIATQQAVSSTSGNTTNLTSIFGGKTGIGTTSDWDVFLRTVRSKLGPVPSETWDAMSGTNAVGQPVNFNKLDSKNILLSRTIPLAAQDAYQSGTGVIQAGGSVPAGIGTGLGAFLLSAFGGGVQQYNPKPSKFRGSGGGPSGDPFGAGGGGANSNPWGAP